MKKLLIILLLLISISSHVVFATDDGHTDSKENHRHVNHIEIIGGTHYHIDEHVIDPSVGFAYIRMLPFIDYRIGIGIEGEYTFSDHNHMAFALPVSFRIWDHLILGFAPGIVFEPTNYEHIEFQFKVMIGYHIDLNSIFIGPHLEGGFKGEGDFFLALGVGVGIHF